MLTTADNAHRRGDLAKAERLYRKLLKKKFSPIVAARLGTCLLQQKKPGQAVHFLRLAAKGNLGEAYNNLAVGYKFLHRLDEACETLKEAVRLNPQDFHALCNLGSTLHELGRNEEAEGWLRKCLELKPDHVDGNWNLGLVLLSLGQFTDEAWASYDWGFKAKERFGRPYVGHYQEWLGEDLEGKSILVWGEQGIGDEILFANCIPDLVKASKKVYFDCHPRLEGIFRNSFPEVEINGGRKSTDWSWLDPFAVDYHCPLGSLPRFFRKGVESFPDKGYLKADPSEWIEKLPGIRIGLSWRGGASKTGMNYRSMPFHTLATPLMLPLKRYEEVQFISLQYGDVYEELEQFNSATGVKVFHDENALEHYEETANLVASCDLVVSVITAVVHLAGALDVPTWCLVPQSAPWKFIPGEHLPWHPSVRQYHQKDKYAWEPVVAQVADDLTKWMQVRKIEAA